MDYIAFSKQFFAAVGIPVNLLRGGQPVYSSLGELTALNTQEKSWPLYPPSRNPEFSAINPDLEYGHVKIEGTDFDLFIGPVFTSPVTEQLVREFFEEVKTPPEYQETLTELLYALPVTSHPQLIRYLLFLHLILNGREGRFEDFYTEERQETARRETKILETAIEAKENEDHRSSYDFETTLYHYIQRGSTKRLQAFLAQTREFPSEGKTQRSGAAKMPEGVSAEIYRCMTYIQSHTNMAIGVDDVAREIGRSSSYLMRRFKTELGMSVGEYITKCKLEEACDMLLYGERSLAEISAYLGYSSQSYFQNVFKKQLGMTPMQYRRQKRKADQL